jgi:uncharacterized integral membrane protein
MKTPASTIAAAGLLLLLTLIFGLSLSSNLRHNDPRASGKPLAGALPTFHKLAALAIVITLAFTIRNIHRGSEFKGVEWTFVIITGLLFLLMFVTGSLLSLGKAANHVLQMTHKIAAIFATISTFLAIYLLTLARR